MIPVNQIIKQKIAKYHQLEPQLTPDIIEIIDHMQTWQLNRLSYNHPDLAKQPHFNLMSELVFIQLYHFKHLTMLVGQVELLLKQKVKLERWLPADVLNLVESTLDLALMSLELDLAVAQYLDANQLEVNDQNAASALKQLDQYQLRQQQLKYLADSAPALCRHAQSWVILSAMKLAYAPAKRRGFDPLFQWARQSVSMLRKSGRHANLFFQQFCAEDIQLLQYLKEHPEQDFKLEINKEFEVSALTAIE